MISNKEKAAVSKSWLMRSHGSHRYIKALERRRASFTFANITKYENDGSCRPDAIENAQETKMLEYSEINRVIDETRAEVEASDVETIRTINQLTSNLQKSILVERYINLSNWDEIARRVGYSRAHVQRLHGVALLAIYKILYMEGKA